MSQEIFNIFLKKAFSKWAINIFVNLMRDTFKMVLQSIGNSC